MFPKTALALGRTVIATLLGRLITLLQRDGVHSGVNAQTVESRWKNAPAAAP
jgi:hypothetical protein